MVRVIHETYRLKHKDDPPEPEYSETEYFVEGIADVKVSGRTLYFLIKWRNFPAWDNTWEPLSGLSSARETVVEFLTNLKGKRANFYKDIYNSTICENPSELLELDEVDDETEDPDYFYVSKREDRSGVKKHHAKERKNSLFNIGYVSLDQKNAISNDQGVVIPENLEARISNAVIYDAVIYDAVIYDAVISDAVISDAVISDAVISDAVISDAVISDAVISDAVLVSDAVLMSDDRQKDTDPAMEIDPMTETFDLDKNDPPTDTNTPLFITSTEFHVFVWKKFMGIFAKFPTLPKKTTKLFNTKIRGILTYVIKKGIPITSLVDQEAFKNVVRACSNERQYPFRGPLPPSNAISSLFTSMAVPAHMVEIQAILD